MNQLDSGVSEDRDLSSFTLLLPLTNPDISPPVFVRLEIARIELQISSIGLTFLIRGFEVGEH